MPKIHFTIPYPAFIERLAVAIVLHHRIKHYGFAFRRIKLTNGRFAIVDPDDYQKLSQYNWQLFENGKKNYAVRIGGNKMVFMHRVIMNAPAGKIVDHRNGEGLDNTRRNLRFATCAQNNYNVKRTKKGSSKYRGVSWHKATNKWMAYINYNCKKIHLGYFENEADAARAHDQAAKKYHGEFAVLNFPPSESPQLGVYPREIGGWGVLKNLNCVLRG